MDKYICKTNENNNFFSIKDENIEPIDIIALAILFGVVAVCFMYGDTKAYVYYIYDFWGSIFEGGGIRNFREYAYQMFLQYRENGIGEAYAANYNFSIHLILGIWGIPIWLVAKLKGTVGHIDYWMLIYVKALFVLFALLTAYIVKKVCTNLKIDKLHSNLAAFLFLSSSLVFTEIGLLGQIDILGLPFLLLGIDSFQKGKYAKFIIFFAIATTFKQFPFFIFFPLLLLIQKNVIRIGLDSVLVLGFSKIVELPLYHNTEASVYKDEFSKDALRVLLGNKILIYNRDVPLLIILLGVVCILCYLKELKDEEERNQYVIFISTLSITLVMISFDNNPYWNLILAPFYTILIVYNSEQFKNIILFEIVGMVALILSQYSINYWCFDSVFCKGTLLEKIFGNSHNYITMYRLISHFDLNEYAGVLYAVFVVCMGGILYISIPGKIQQNSAIGMKKAVMLRVLINGIVAFIPIMLYIISSILG